MRTTAATPQHYAEAREVGRRVREARIRKMLTQKEVADKTDGMSQGNISRIERGAVYPQVATLKRLADALGIEVSELVS